jgi:hypothetical protein
MKKEQRDARRLYSRNANQPQWSRGPNSPLEVGSVRARPQVSRNATYYRQEADMTFISACHPFQAL